MNQTNLNIKLKSKFLALNDLFNNFINKGHERSTKAKKNIIASFFIKGLSIAISLVIVPLTIDYINPSRYGIWITLSSVVGWFNFFDIGLSQGLRNKFAEAKAKGDDEIAQIYVSTTYAILAIIFAIVWLLFLISNSFLNWSHILNVSDNMRQEVSILAVIVFTYFCLQFVLKIINTLILADQQPAKASLNQVLGQVVSLIFIVILVKTTQGSLIKLGIAFCLSPIIVLLGANIYYFRGSLKRYKPTFAKIKFRYAKGLFNLGVVFFIIQIAGIVQYETANIIIAQNFGTADVTSFNIVYKYFGMLDMVFAVFLTPFWSASTEAYMKNDVQWIKNGMKKYTRLNMLLIGVGIIMLVLSETIYSLWLGKGKVTIGYTLSFWGLIYFALTMFALKYVFFLNGINALRIQLWACIFSPIVYVGIAFLLIRYYHMGVYSLFIAAILANFNGYILSPLQYHMVINKNKKGIWIR